MKKLVTVLGLILLVGCADKVQTIKVEGTPGNNGQDGYSIVTKAIANPAICGVAGGTSVLLALDLNRDLQFDNSDQVQTQYVTCNGTNGLDGADGQDGSDGTNGTNGSNGLNGTSCTVNKVGTVATITCGNSSTVVVDGSKGDKGDTGNTGPTGPAGTNVSGIYITEIINPCGEEFANDEVFLKLSTGRILALYDGGPQEDRLALIAPGNYITTDRTQNRACAFTITSDYQVTNQVVQSPGNGN